MTEPASDDPLSPYARVHPYHSGCVDIVFYDKREGWQTLTMSRREADDLAAQLVDPKL